MHSKTEQELIQELKKDSIKAFNAIYEMYSRKLYAFCLKYTKSRETAEEIMEDTFIWIWNNRHAITQEYTLKALLFIRTRHFLINAYRKVINSPIYENYMDYLDHNSTSTDTTGSMVEYDDFIRYVNKLMEKLPPTQQKIIRLSKLEMLSNKEIAEKLNYSEQTVKNQLSLGLKRLKLMMGNSLPLAWVLIFNIN